MIELSITGVQQKKAQFLYKFYNLSDSITEGRSQIYGALGEILVHDYFHHRGYSMSFSSCYNYDMTVNFHKVEVKTLRIADPPKPNFRYSATVSSTQRQQYDHIFFVNVLESLQKGWLMGYCSKQEFCSKAQLNLKGTQAENGFVYKADDYTISATQLTPVYYYR